MSQYSAEHSTHAQNKTLALHWPVSLSRLQQLRELAVDSLFPRRCVGCGKMGDFICPRCLAELPRLLPPICPKCGRPQASGMLCAMCRQKQSSLDGIRSPFRFEGTMRKSIHHLKYHNLRAISSLLADLLARYLQQDPLPGDILMPVPLHSKKLKQRGYNQSSLLAQKLADLTGIPVVEDCLIRITETPPQARTANIKQRQQNVQEAFVCQNEKARGKQIILIDDVCTSESTLESCAKALKDNGNGASSVWGLTLAREI